MSRLGYCLALLLWMAAASAQAQVPQAFLLQNSGWMEPFYADPRSQFKPLAAALIEAVTNPADPVYVLAFNQATPGNESPRLLYPGGGASPRQALAGLELAHKQGGALADTDFQEAVGATILKQFQGKPGILWIFTNNKNSPNNSPETARHNQAFYDLLHHEPAIVRSLVFPLGMPVKGKVYEAHGLMVYALAYGKAADAHLQALLDQGRISRVLTEQAARLKPLDKESVRLTPKEISQSQAVKISLAADGKTIVMDVDATDKQPGVEVKALLENLFYPYLIRSAKLSAKLWGPGFAYPLAVEPAAITDLPPKRPQEVSVTFPIPHAQIPSVWSLSRLGSLGTQLSIVGNIAVSLEQQQLELDPGFAAKLDQNFHGDPISQVLTPPQTAQASEVSIPLLVRVSYPVYPIIILIALALALVLGLFAALNAARRPRRYELTVDGRAQKLALRPFQTLPVHSEDGELAGEVRRGFARLEITRTIEGHRITITA